jgi:hypothetical protein
MIVEQQLLFVAQVQVSLLGEQMMERRSDDNMLFIYALYRIQ